MRNTNDIPNHVHRDTMNSALAEKDVEIARLAAEAEKYKKWFDWKSKANGRLLAELSTANLRIVELEAALSPAPAGTASPAQKDA